MRNKLLFIVILLYLADLYPQDTVVNYSNYVHSFGIQITTGITSFKMSKAKSFFHDFLMNNINRGIPLEAQKVYPVNILWGGSMYYYPSRELSFNLGAELTSTNAYSLYGDYLGTFDAKSLIELLSIEFAVKKHFMELFLQPFAGVQAGILKGNFTLEENIQFIGLPQNSNSWKVEYSKIGYCIEAFIGASYNLEYVVLDLQAGYRYSVIPKPSDGDLGDSRFFYENIYPDLETSGIALKLSARSGIFW